MTTRLSGKIEEAPNVQYLDDDTAGVVHTTQAGQGPQVTDNWEIRDGVGTDQAKIMVVRRITLAAGASETIDLQALVDKFNATLVLTKVKYLKIIAAAGNQDTIEVGNAAANAWFPHMGAATHTLKIIAGGSDRIQEQKAGYTVSGTAKNLKILNNDGANPATFDIIIVGIE